MESPGGRLIEQLQRRGVSVLGGDFDPETVRQYRRCGLAVVFGDAHDSDFLESLPLTAVRWVVSSLPQRDVDMALLRALRAHGYHGGIAIAAHNDEDAAALKRAGVTKALTPFSDAADYGARTIVESLSAARSLP